MTPVASVEAARPRAAIVYNPKKLTFDALRTEVERIEQERGWAPSLWIPSKPKSARPIAQAIAARVELVIVSGGDGSVRRAIADLEAVDLPLGIVPTGTGNLLARALGLPIANVPAALEVAFGEYERHLDVIGITALRDSGEVRRETSVVLSGVGLDAAMIENTRAELKSRLGWIAYVDGVMRSLGHLSPFTVRLRIDDGPARAHRASAVWIANLAELPGNVSLSPQAALDDGVLDVIVLQPRRAIDWLLIWRRFSWENAVLRRSAIGVQIAETFKGRNRSQVLVRRGKRVELTLDDEPQPFQVDGDAIGPVRSLSATVNRHGMRVRVPAP